MPTPDAKQKLLELFAGTVEVRRPDLPQVLATPAKDLDAGREQASALLAGAVRPNAAELVPGAIGRQRFPELQGTAGFFAEGLARNPDIVAEILAAPEDLAAAIAIDQAV